MFNAVRRQPRSPQIARIDLALLARSTVLGLRCKDGVVLAVEKLIISKLLVEGSNRRIYNVDRHAGVVSRRKLVGKWLDPTHVINTMTDLSIISSQAFHARGWQGLDLGPLPSPCMRSGQVGAMHACTPWSYVDSCLTSTPRILQQATSGLAPDGRMIVSRAADEASNYKRFGQGSSYR